MTLVPAVACAVASSIERAVAYLVDFERSNSLDVQQRKLFRGMSRVSASSVDGIFPQKVV